MNRASIGEMNEGILELTSLCDLWVKQLATTTSTDEEDSIDGPAGYNPSPVYNWNKLKITHEADFPEEDIQLLDLKMKILFKSEFDNKGDGQQENRFRAERVSVSRAEVTVYDGVLLPVNGVRVTIPDDVATANAGFPTELDVCSTEQHAWEESMRWNVDTKIQVGPRKKVRAEMMVEEEQWKGSFSVATTIRGKIRANYTLANGTVQSSITDVASLVSEAKRKGLQVANIWIDNNAVSFTTKGEIKFRYGVKQFVDVTEL